MPGQSGEFKITQEIATRGQDANGSIVLKIHTQVIN